MEKLKYVEVQCYNTDWGTVYTDSIWVGTGEIPEAYDADNGSYDEVKEYCEVLEKAGFERVITKEVTFGGNL